MFRHSLLHIWVFSDPDVYIQHGWISNCCNSIKLSWYFNNSYKRIKLIIYFYLFLVLESDWLRGVRYSSDIGTPTVSPVVSLCLQYSHSECHGGYPIHYNFINNTVFVSRNVVLKVFRQECSCLDFRYAVC